MTEKISFEDEWKLISKSLIFRDEVKKSATKRQFEKLSTSNKKSIYEQLYKLCIKLLSDRDKKLLRLEKKLKEEKRINMGYLATINTMKSKRPTDVPKRTRTCKNCGKTGHDSRTCHLYNKNDSSSDSSSDDDEIYMENIVYQGVMYQKNIETDEIFCNSECVGEWDIETRSIEWKDDKFKIIHETNHLYIKD
tara:strand:+ start:408 stop:986 length:579 start_codon:yes stop_codon:yes gene_type:complete